MILGETSPCFQEIDEAVAQVQASRSDNRPVVFNFQAGEVPRGSIIWNFDYPGVHFPLGAMRVAANRADEVWDFSLRGVAMWKAMGIDAKHVPLGIHPSMIRFGRHAVRDIDIVFCGSINARRASVLNRLKELGYSVALASENRAERDAMLARCRTSFNMLFYPDGVYPSLRAIHLFANGVPFVSERAPEMPASCEAVDIVGLVDAIARNVEEQKPGCAFWKFLELP